MSETPEVTPVNEWTVPNQDKLEQVIDNRLGKTHESEEAKPEDDPAPTDDETKEQAEEPES